MMPYTNYNKVFSSESQVELTDETLNFFIWLHRKSQTDHRERSRGQ